MLSKGTAGPHKIQGIGAGFVPKILDTGIYDEILPIENEDAFAEGKHFALAEGIMVGISSGAALKAASILAARAGKCREEDCGASAGFRGPVSVHAAVYG